MTTAGEPGSDVPSGRSRLGLRLATVAVALAAADTYVVVLALPEMMSGLGIAVDQLQRAAPIVSGFLLGYVAVLPLIGRLADLRGRLPVLVGSLLLFALGSLVTAAAYDLPSLVAGRVVQGAGAGGLVPATLALVADRYPPNRRALPLGVVGAVQEAGSVLGPLYGALVLAVAGWREIFWVNLVAGVGLAAAIGLRPGTERRGSTTGNPPRADLPGGGLALVALVLLTLTLLRPPALAQDVTLGLAFVPLVGSSRWLAPVALTFAAVLALLVLRCVSAQRPLLDVRRWGTLGEDTDLAGAGLLALGLGLVVVAFASADPQVQVLTPDGPYLLGAAVLALLLFRWRSRKARTPLLPVGTFGRRPARGAVLASFFVGAALVAVLVDVPVFARLTVAPGSQLEAALVLVRFLAAVPVGAVLGGWLTRRLPAGAVTVLGTGSAALCLLTMTRWDVSSLDHASASLALVGAGLGFGLALAPVQATLLAATEPAVHGVVSAFLVVARMVGMLVGISALTTIGLRRYYAVEATLPGPGAVCGSGTRCPAYTDMLREAGLAQLHTVFGGAAVCAALAAAVAAATFRTTPLREVTVLAWLRPPG